MSFSFQNGYRQTTTNLVLHKQFYNDFYCYCGKDLREVRVVDDFVGGAVEKIDYLYL